MAKQPKMTKQNLSRTTFLRVIHLRMKNLNRPGNGRKEMKRNIIIPLKMSELICKLENCSFEKKIKVRLCRNKLEENADWRNLYTPPKMFPLTLMSTFFTEERNIFAGGTLCRKKLSQFSLKYN